MASKFDEMRKRAEKLTSANMHQIAPHVLPGVKPEDLKDIKCKECGGEAFVPVGAIKYVSILQSAVSLPGIVHLPVGFACLNCKAVNSLDETHLSNEIKEQASKAGDLGVSVGDGIVTKDKLN